MFSKAIFTPPFIRLLASNLFFWMSVNLLTPTIPVHFHHSGYPPYDIGMIVGFFALGAVLFRIPSGRWVDRLGSTKVLGTGIFFAALALGLLIFANSVPLLLLSRFIYGASITGYSAAALTLNSIMHKPEHQNEAVGIFTLFIMIGNGIAFSSSLFIYNALGFEAVASLSFGFTLLTILLFPKNIPLPHLKKKTGESSETMPLGTVAKNPGVWIPSLCQFGSNFAFGALFTFTPLMFESIGASGLTHYYIAYAISVVLTRAFIGKILARITTVRLLTWLLYGFALTLAIGIMPPSSYSAFLTGSLIGLTYGLIFPALIPVVTQHTHLAERGTAFGLFTISVDIGSAFGSMFLGSLVAFIGFDGVFGAAALILVFMGLLYQFFLRTILEQAPLIKE